MVKTPDNAIELNKRAINRLQLTPFMAVEDSPFYPQIVQAMQFPVSRPFYEFSLDHSDIIALASFHLPFGPISRLDAITRRH